MSAARRGASRRGATRSGRSLSCSACRAARNAASIAGGSARSRTGNAGSRKIFWVVSPVRIAHLSRVLAMPRDPATGPDRDLLGPTQPYDENVSRTGVFRPCSEDCRTETPIRDPARLAAPLFHTHSERSPCAYRYARSVVSRWTARRLGMYAARMAVVATGVALALGDCLGQKRCGKMMSRTGLHWTIQRAGPE